MAANRPVLGRILLLVTGLLGVAALTIFLFVEPVEIAAWLVDPNALLIVVGANVALAILRLFSTGHAWVVSGGHRWIAAALLMVIVAIPHAAVAWMGLETRDSLLKVFAYSGPVAAAAASTSVPGRESTTTTSAAATTSTQVRLVPLEPAPGQYGYDDIDPAEFQVWRPFGEKRLNVLVLGGDAGPGRQGLRTDTIIVASIDPVSGDAALIGIPRNFGGVSLKDGTVVPVSIINAVYGWGLNHPDRFPGRDPGASAIREVVENLTGLEIDYYLLVDLTGFSDLIDAFGGVHLRVPEDVDGPLYDPETGGYEMVRIEAGDQHLDGDRALAYARARYGSSDYVRMGRQRCILAAMADDADLTLLGRLGDLLDVIEANVATDLPVEVLPDLVRLLPRVEPDRIRVIGFDSAWNVGRTAEGYAIPDITRIRQTVVAMIDQPDASTELGVTSAEAACG